MKSSNLFKGMLVAVLALTMLTGCSSNSNSTDNPSSGSSSTNSDDEVFTTEELANYNGKNGAAAYVAYEGLVYDVTDAKGWFNGEHEGVEAGTDITEAFANSPHTPSIFDGLNVVGTFSNN